METQKKILIVDDDANLRRTLADIMRIKGYETLVAANGAAAIAAAKQEIFSLALIDLMLPDMSGMDVMERLKAVSPLTETIILTGHASLDTAIEATRHGAFSYVVKPYQMDDLLLNIRHGIDRYQAQAEIRRLSEALKQCHEAIIIVDAGLRFEYVNPAFTQLFGYTMGELAGQPISLIDAPEDSADTPLQVAEIATTQGEFTGETSRRAKDGRIVPVLLNVAPVRDERGRIVNYVGAMTNLTAIKNMEASLRESEEQFRSISSSAKDAIIMLDDNGAISFWNAAAETIFSYSAAEVLGKDLHLLLAPTKFHPAYLANFANFKASGQGAAVGKTLELAAIRKNGAEFPMEISLSAVKRKDHWLGIGIVRDISERKRAEAEAKTHLEELSRANKALKELNNKLEQAQSQVVQSEKMASIGMLAAGVAHEINNPVGFIKSNMQSLREYVADFLRVINSYEKAEAMLPEHKESFLDLHQLEEQVEFDYKKKDIVALLSESSQGLDRVTKIVQDLKDFSRMETQDTWLTTDIHKGIESTLNVIWNELKYKCEVKKEYGTLPPVECVLSQLNQVFMNLLVNAAQAIETKGAITIRTGTAGNEVWIEISDTGKGIPPDQINRIFEPFFTTKPVGKGTGLGLSVSYGIIQKHRGRIEVESTPGKGTTFRVWLPVRHGRNGE